MRKNTVILVDRTIRLFALSACLAFVGCRTPRGNPFPSDGGRDTSADANGSGGAGITSGTGGRGGTGGGSSSGSGGAGQGGEGGQAGAGISGTGGGPGGSTGGNATGGAATGGTSGGSGTGGRPGTGGGMGTGTGGAPSGTCTPGAKTCNGNQPQTCTSAGAWENTGGPCAGCSMCATATGTCAPATGPACNDNNACTVGETCQAGVCKGGTTVTCPGADQCHTVGACVPATGCPAPANKTGACNDGNACTTGETCQSGVCTGGSAVTCAATNQCQTVGACVPSTGCPAPVNRTGSCNDNNGCTTGESCQNGTCGGGTPKTCTAPTCMVVAACVPSTGNCPTPTAAPDGTPCSGGTCKAGSCCVDNNNACSGKTCGTVVNNCGRTITCAPNMCANYSSCQNNNCSCQPNSRPLACSSASAPICGFWSFETGKENWAVESHSDAWTGAESISTAYHSGTGFRSLSAGFDGSLGNFLVFEVPICPTNLAGARITAHVHFAFTSPATSGVSVYAALQAGDSDVDLFVGVPQGNEIVLDGVVGAMDAPDDPTSRIYVHIDDADSPNPGWTGTVYIDEIQIR